MIKKDELIQSLSESGIQFNEKAPKPVLERIAEKNGLIKNGLLIKTKPDETKPDETKPDETKPDETKPDETKPDETKPDETKPDETKPDETKPDEKPDSLEELKKRIHEAETQIKQENIIDIKEGGTRPPLIEITKTRKSKKSKSDSFVLEGLVLLTIVDTILPQGITLLNNVLNKSVKIDKEQIMLTAKQFEKITPLADQAADYLAFNINPVAGFFIVISIFYASNTLDVLTEKYK